MATIPKRLERLISNRKLKRNLFKAQLPDDVILSCKAQLDFKLMLYTCTWLLPLTVIVTSRLSKEFSILEIVCDEVMIGCGLLLFGGKSCAKCLFLPVKG